MPEHITFPSKVYSYAGGDFSVHIEHVFYFAMSGGVLLALPNCWHTPVSTIIAASKRFHSNNEKVGQDSVLSRYTTAAVVVPCLDFVQGNGA